MGSKTTAVTLATVLTAAVSLIGLTSTAGTFKVIVGVEGRDLTSTFVVT